MLLKQLHILPLDLKYSLKHLLNVRKRRPNFLFIAHEIPPSHFLNQDQLDHTLLGHCYSNYIINS